MSKVRVLAGTRKGAFILTAIVLGATHQIIPFPLAIAYILMSVLAIGLYGKDKFAAKRHQWRTSEGSLHIVGLLGGWPGAMLAQGLFHHKTAKRSFRRAVLVVFGLQAALGLLLAWRRIRAVEVVQ